MTAALDRACAVPLVERLLSVPKDASITLETHFMEDGTCVGHRHIPAGYLMHEAAAALSALASPPGAIREAALEEAARHIEPKNPPEDWTDFARIRDAAAMQIRKLKLASPAQEGTPVARFVMRIKQQRDKVADALRAIQPNHHALWGIPTAEQQLANIMRELDEPPASPTSPPAQEQIMAAQAVSSCDVTERKMPGSPGESPAAAAPSPDGKEHCYWLIERGSPCEWLENYRSGIDYWTTDATKAMRGPKAFLESLIPGWHLSNARVTEHLDCDAPIPPSEKERERLVEELLAATMMHDQDPPKLYSLLVRAAAAIRQADAPVGWKP